MQWLRSCFVICIVILYPSIVIVMANVLSYPFLVRAILKFRIVNRNQCVYSNS